MTQDKVVPITKLVSARKREAEEMLRQIDAQMSNLDLLCPGPSSGPAKIAKDILRAHLEDFQPLKYHLTLEEAYSEEQLKELNEAFGEVAEESKHHSYDQLFMAIVRVIREHENSQKIQN